MNEETIKEIFIAVAFRAMEEGKELRLEKGKNTSMSKVLGGGFMNSSTDYDSLVLTVSQQMQELLAKEEEEEEEEEDDAAEE
jgi:hypothetical protein